MGALIAVVISIGGLVEIAPLYMQSSVLDPSPGVKPYSALAMEGRDIYVREGCYNCHSQMVRPLPAETERYGHYSLAGEAVYDHPFQFGSKRTGPDLARVGGRYSARSGASAVRLQKMAIIECSSVSQWLRNDAAAPIRTSNDGARLPRCQSLVTAGGWCGTLARA